ncbi:helix-turn-helix domain-containing protein [Levilactobacillus brevis]|nr:helix-turn-helix transcriptional regulator [Levilactobacillus brevis]MCE6009454.1 helix-turn-helix domain-containing protein [Levilactobacillus brevis]MCE6013884.1 helix-turn-helix domain-containing protein [Levilactobacillus brevis]MCE6016242.1 helix-turn-helix domain-containing protein [Levilactobacillus brevis]MCE6018657.1 helix-turn-helix domain-containing protein [Levilactobacillus brevis]MCE6020880.1 helix-turn-helix domain-containing protein [Levilactobacillus brevis]
MSSYDPKKVGKRIKMLRISKGMTMNEFGNLIDSNVKSGTVTNWESGKNAPNKKRLKRIADLCGVSVDFLLNGTQMSIRDIKRFQSALIDKNTLTNEEKRIAREISIENRLAIQAASEPFDKISRQVFKDSFLAGLSPEERALANQISILFGKISDSGVSDNFLEGFTVYLREITGLLSGSISKKDFGEYQDTLSKCIDKNFK